MKLFNPDLLKPRNLVVIAAVAIGVRFLMAPVMKMIDGGSNSQQG